MWVQSLGQEGPLEEEKQPAPVFLPGGSHGQRSLMGYRPWGHKEWDLIECLSTLILPFLPPASPQTLDHRTVGCTAECLFALTSLLQYSSSVCRLLFFLAVSFLLYPIKNASKLWLLICPRIYISWELLIFQMWSQMRKKNVMILFK